MDRPPPHLAASGSPSGAAMDRVVPRRRGKRIALLAAGCALAAGAAAALWQAVPRGLQVPLQDVRIATVAKGVFRDDIVVRATAEPLDSVILDSVESGRVEEVFARDGAMVAKGELLFRLSNPQRNLELLARQAEHAQQSSNLSNLRLSQEAGRTDHQRRLSDLRFALAKGQKQHARNVALAAQGFISQVALEESGDRLAQQRHALAQEQRSSDTEAGVRGDALAQMEKAIKGLQSGLLLVGATVDALAVRAPVAGMLTGFRLQVGQTVKTDQHIGRVDDPRRLKLAAQVDEFYLNRVAVGRQDSARQDDGVYPVAVSTIYPQIKDGRFTVEMAFSGAQPAALSPGQSLDAQLTLGEPARATLLPNGAFLGDSGGAWVFVLAADGALAQRRAVRLGRRSNKQVEVLSGLAPGEKVIVSAYAAFGKSERLQLSR
ncbi:efflux RND transporter periplasmic adaptor subunit [Massilia glaciei]|uniref:Efflux transporter periplasmic adaptor subunit n=1 Tax=Massilia glaciei TaxID=1524097 RepID=A0A2U2HFC6_9BURK|nr:HlyD family efflux transporter periplasmic adaptor subunit [Massilia glaciei]PWF42900.1 efflux transporter periplasmic adaptor subunit [Massilia glaciei]